MCRMFGLVFLLVAGCGDGSDPAGTNGVCGSGVSCGNVHTHDLLTQPFGVTVEVLREYVVNKKTESPLKKEGDGEGDLDDLMCGIDIAQNLYGINPIFALALSLHESGWGRSKLSRLKNNMWGWNSGLCDKANQKCTDSFDNADGFSSFRAGFNHVFRKIKRNYLTEGGIYHQTCGSFKRKECVGGNVKKPEECGASLAGMNCKYAADDKWGEKIREHMNQITTFINAHGVNTGTCPLSLSKT